MNRERERVKERKRDYEMKREGERGSKNKNRKVERPTDSLNFSPFS